MGPALAKVNWKQEKIVQSKITRVCREDILKPGSIIFIICFLMLSLDLVVFATGKG